MKTAPGAISASAMKFACASAAGLALLLAIPAARADDWTHHYSVTGRPAIHLTVSDGDVQIQRGGGNAVDVDINSVHYNISNDVRITENQNGNSIDIAIHPRPMHWFKWGISMGTGLKVTIAVPAEADLDIDTGDGNIAAAPVSGRIQFSTSDGNISTEGLKGTLKLHSGDGHIDARDLDGSLAADTGDGNMSLQGRFDSLDVRTGDGSVEVEAAANSQPSTSGWRIKSGDGSIVLRVPSAFRANLEARTGDGRISVNFPLTVSGTLNESSLSAKINGGGPTVEVHTGDGSIRIERQ
jgi:DUF4097 and DUF4098 domain-containing protein YvlB